MEKSVINLLDGVHEDCETLLLKFEKLNTARFTEFCELWKDMKFSLIYGEKTIHELEIFVPEILLLVKRFFVKSTGFNLKVGALYMLYALYYKQPFKDDKKILVTYEDWLSIKEFIKELKESQHHDTLLIIYKLISDNAFIFTATEKYRYDLAPEKIKMFGLFDINLLIDDVELDNDLQELKDIEEQYTLSKYIACEQTTNDAYKEVVNYCSNIADDISDMIKNDNVDILTNEPGPSMPDTSAVSQEYDIGLRRKSLKSRCFKGKVSPTKTKSSPKKSVN